MIREKLFWKVERQLPEKEWEAEYLNERNRTELNYMLTLILITMAAIFLVYAVTVNSQCEIHVSGQFDGDIQGAQSEEMNKIFNKLQVRSVDGEMTISGSCALLAGMRN